MGTVTTLDQDQGDDEYTEFWNIIGNDGDIGPDEDRDDKKATSESFQPLLYRVDGNLQKELQLVATSSTEILMGHPKAKASACFKKSDLLEDDVFLIDTGWEIYVWIGSAADRYEKIASMSAADKYAKMDARTAELPVHIVKSGHESDTFLALFA
jgi:gelsolin